MDQTRSRASSVRMAPRATSGAAPRGDRRRPADRVRTKPSGWWGRLGSDAFRVVGGDSERSGSRVAAALLPDHDRSNDAITS